MPHGIWKGTLGFGLVNIEPEEAETRVLDLMAALKRSVESKGKAAPRRKPASRSRTTGRKSA